MNGSTARNSYSSGHSNPGQWHGNATNQYNLSGPSYTSYDSGNSAQGSTSYNALMDQSAQYTSYRDPNSAYTHMSTSSSLAANTYHNYTSSPPTSPSAHFSPSQHQHRTPSYSHQTQSQQYPPAHPSYGLVSEQYTHTHTRPRSHSQTHPYLPKTAPHHTSASSAYSSGYSTHSGLSHSHSYPHADSSAPTSNKPYLCDLCNLSFSRQHDLKRHRDTHSGEKPYPCNGGCNKTFTRKDALKRHQIVKNCGIVAEE